MKKHYLIDDFYELLKSDKQAIYFKTSLCDEETAKNCSHMLLEYGEDGVMHTAKSLSIYNQPPVYKNVIDHETSNKDLLINTLNLTYKEYPLNHIYHFVVDDRGEHTLGGTPRDFDIPQSTQPFIYIGKISHTSEPLSWLPFDLPLAMPIFSDVEKVFLDYSNPNAPRIVNNEEVNAAYDCYDYGLDIQVEYKATSFRCEKQSAFFEHEFEDVSYAGIPEWVQYPYFPKCPKTGEYMRFVCQLASGKAQLSFTNSKYKQDLERLDFWGAGCLYVFFEPQSKIACLFIQNT